jgi:hypothetical protein
MKQEHTSGLHVLCPYPDLPPLQMKMKKKNQISPQYSENSIGLTRGNILNITVKDVTTSIQMYIKLDILKQM